MKKIMFDDRHGLTKAVLEGRKTMTRRRIVPPRTMEGKDVPDCPKGQKESSIELFGFDGSWNGYFSPRDAFAALIDRICGKDTWKNNPYVFVYEFELVEKH